MDDVENKGLDADIAALLDVERAVENAPTAAKERVWERVRETIASAPVSAPPAPAAALAGQGPLVPLGIAALAGAVLIVALPQEDTGSMWTPPPEVSVQRLMDAPVDPAVTLSPVTAPVVVVPEASPAPDEPLESAKPAQAPSVERKRRPSAALGGAEAEQALLDRGRRALREGRAALALKIASEHKSKFRLGRLAEEREALHIRALDRLGKRDASHEAARRFLKRYPTSIHRLAMERVLGTD